MRATALCRAVRAGVETGTHPLLAAARTHTHPTSLPSPYTGVMQLMAAMSAVVAADAELAAQWKELAGKIFPTVA